MPGRGSWGSVRRTAPPTWHAPWWSRWPGTWRRVMEVVTVGRLGGSTVEGVTLGGAGSGLPCGSRCSRPYSASPRLRHRSGEAASAGAALLAGKALGLGLTLDQIDPVAAVIQPTPTAVELYRAVAATGRPRGRGRARRDRFTSGNQSLRDLIRARRPVLRPPRTVVEVPDRRRGDSPGGRAGSGGRGSVDHRGAAAAVGAEGRLPACSAAHAERVAVAFPDLTRPMPNRTVLPPLLAELERCGVPNERITLLCATGTHRQATAAEMEELVGPEIVGRYAVVDHDATSPGAHRGGRGGRGAGAAAARVRRGRPAHRDRIRRAALLRRLQRRPEGRLPGTRRQR